MSEKSPMDFMDKTGSWIDHHAGLFVIVVLALVLLAGAYS